MTNDNWKTVRIPKNSKIYQRIENNNNIAPWRVLEKIVQSEPKSKEEKAREILDEFIIEMVKIYPEKKAQIQNIVVYFIKRIFKNVPIDDDYFDSLRDFK